MQITPLAHGCELVLVHQVDPQWSSYADRVRAGWTTMLEALGRALR
jgi:hypothetical protein